MAAMPPKTPYIKKNEIRGQPKETLVNKFEEYRQNFASRSPNLENQKYDDELKEFENLQFLGNAPFEDAVVDTPPVTGGTPFGTNTYLWAIRAVDIPIISKIGEEGQKTTRKRASHTNLTGGDEAHSGGELWFEAKDTFWFSGGSSRYQPRNPSELEAIEGVFTELGYKEISFGWDFDLNMPARVYRSES